MGGSYFINYIPRVQGSEWNRGVKQRIIWVQNVSVDLLELTKYKVSKVPRGSPYLPVTVLHSPSRTVDHKEAISWKIPPVISNWKNPKGYIMPLDKRIMADGRVLQDTKIN